MVGPIGPDPFVGQTIRQRQERERDPLSVQTVNLDVTNVTSAGNTTLYTVSDEKWLRIDDFGIVNIEGSNTTVTVWVVPSGGSALNTNKAYDAYPILANDSGTLTALIGSTWPPGTFIVATSGGATGVNLWMSGREAIGGVFD